MTLVSSMTRAAAAALGGVLALGLLAGCGGSDDGGGEAEPSEEPTSSETSEATEAPSTGYLPVPTGVTLTEPGTALGFGDVATVAWRPRQDTVVALDLAVERIDETSYAESFEGWVVTKQMKGQVPYFVHVKATNVTGSPVGDLLVPLYALSGAASMYEPLDFREEIFEPCPGGTLPESLGPEKSADLCFVYLLPEGQQLSAAAFDLVGELAPVTWSGRITTIDDGKGDKGDKRDKKDRKKRTQR